MIKSAKAKCENAKLAISVVNFIYDKIIIIEIQPYNPNIKMCKNVLN